MHTTTDIDALKKHPNAVKFFADRVRLRRENKELVGLCPWHQERSPSWHCHQEPDGTWLANCFGCDHPAVNCIQFVSEFDKISMKDAIALVEKELGGDWQTIKSEVEQTFRSVVAEAKDYKSFSLAEYAKQERDLWESDAALSWLEGVRGISPQTAKRLHLGFRQDLGRIAGVRNEAIADKGWVSFPCIQGNRVLSIKYRSIVEKAFCRQPGMASVLFNTETIDVFEILYVVEGELDAACLEQAGFHAVSIQSASSGLTPEQKDQIMRANSVILAGDCDEGVGAKAMDKLWRELGDRSYLLKWPEGMKDANQTFLEVSKRDVKEFAALVENLTSQAKLQPMPDVYSLQEAMQTANRTSLKDHPERLRFPWPTVDNMAIILPGGILSLFATQTGTGKTAFTLDTTLFGARKHGEVVLNYQCELSPDEISAIVAANILSRSRNDISAEELKQAAAHIGGVRYYVGYNPSLSKVEDVLDLIEGAIRRLGATLVVLDHIHFICRNEQNEVSAQANAMQRIKRLAGKYRCKFIVVGQPRKATQQTKGKVVGISDAKGSESYTSDADAVFALHRNTVKNPDPANPPIDNLESKTEVHLLKARSKGEGSALASLMYFGEFGRFTEIAYEYNGEQP